MDTHNKVRSYTWMAKFPDADDLPDRVWSVGEPWLVIVLAPTSGDDDAPTSQWFVYDGSGMPPADHAWPGQREYVLERVEEGDVIGEPGIVAFYVRKP